MENRYIFYVNDRVMCNITAILLDIIAIVIYLMRFISGHHLQDKKRSDSNVGNISSRRVSVFHKYQHYLVTSIICHGRF